MKAALALALMAAAACASTSADSRASSSPKAAAWSCGDSLVPAVAYRGTDVYAGPDGTTSTIATLRQDTQVCAASSTAGFGFRRVTFPDGKTGFVPETNLSL
jgi:hypothetical protein